MESGSVVPNTREMARAFDKRPVDWLRSEPTRRFIEEMTKVRNSHFDDLVVTRQGGVNAGTWLHEDVALEFAKWLSPAFAILYVRKSER